MSAPRSRCLPFCAAHTFHLGRRRDLAKPAPIGPAAPRGTLDFKWSPGDSIGMRVYQSEPSGQEDRDSYAKRLLAECVRRWCTRGNATIDLDVQVLGGFVPAEPDAPVSDPEVQGYDVLVECLWRPGTSVDLAGRTHLGSYARRQTYGEPTLYLPLQGLAEDGEAFAPEDLVATMHELGHVLGLPHAHQSPYLDLDARWSSDLARYKYWLSETFGLDMTEAEIESFIDADLKSTHWGNPAHSQWWPFRPQQDVDSIMTYPGLAVCIDAKAPALGPLGPAGQLADHAGPGLLEWTWPTEADWRLLAEMYGTRPVRP